ncbi:hypothetical protein HZH68_015917 [Vespula germanica]|uniref:Uncharacterized protein n=1 Tax=Vespula germanica TaxID=30212 RepID=A0A834J5N3_VESGE|nr:hypothetical protein HZH68_015917 [Vespula germanica]
MYTSLESTVIASESLYFWAMTTVTEAKAAVVKAAITAIAKAAIATVTDLLLFWLAKRQARILAQPKCESMSKVTYPWYHDPLPPSSPSSNEAVSVKDDGTLSSQIVVAIEFPAVHTTVYIYRISKPNNACTSRSPPSRIFLSSDLLSTFFSGRYVAAGTNARLPRLYQNPLLVFTKALFSSLIEILDPIKEALI